MGKKKMITTTQFAKDHGLAYPTVARWAKAGIIPGAEREETPRGPVWLIPQSSSDNFEKWRPKPGRPMKAEDELKTPRRRKGQA
jgi:hypothetical protein